jgi:hypothetical protein
MWAMRRREVIVRWYRGGKQRARRRDINGNARPRSVSVQAPRMAGVAGSEPTTLEVQAVQ